jgi:hypothetical protein
MRTSSQKLLIACIFVCLPVYVYSTCSDPGCKTCDVPAVCTECSDSVTKFIDTDSTCKTYTAGTTKCFNTAYWLDGAATIKTCIACAGSCLTCTGTNGASSAKGTSTADQCLTCKGLNVLDPGLTVGACKPCSYKCGTCKNTDADQCYSCNP